MSVSSCPSDKFAFLFSGLTTPRYMADLKSVFDTLVEFYNYPAANIWVVQGADAFVSSGLFPNAVQKAIGVGDPLQNLRDIFHNNTDSFAVTVKTHADTDPPPSGEYCTAILYFTGAQDAANTTLNTNLIIRPHSGVNEVAIIPSDFTLLLQYPNFQPTPADPLLRFCHLNVVMQQDYSNLYYGSVITDSTRILNRTFTNACGSGETSEAVTDGSISKFTDTWIKGLKWEERLTNLDPLLDSEANMYADQIAPTGDPFLINLQQARNFVNKRIGLTNCGFNQMLNTESQMYIGKPAFLIQDGPGSAWWVSNDIYLTHTVGDTTKHTNLYIPDTVTPATQNNRINVAVRNIGTHPVRSYRIGVRVYGTPADGVLVSEERNGNVPAGIVLKPAFKNPVDGSLSNDNYDLFILDTHFYEGTTHECIWAKAELPTDDVVAHPFDFSWNVIANENEAQCNTDEGYDPPKSASGKMPGDSFRGNKQHIYRIQNPFKETHRFVLSTVPEYHKSLDSAVMNWYVAGQKRKREKLRFERIEKGFTVASFLLKGGEKKVIMGEFGFKSGSKVKMVKFPVEILVDKIDGSKTRQPQSPSLRGKYAALSGFSVIITNDGTNLAVVALDKKKNPVPGALINVKTVNGLAEESLIADKNGQVLLKSINPDIYCIKGSLKKYMSNEKIVPVFGKETVRITLELTKG